MVLDLLKVANNTLDATRGSRQFVCSRCTAFEVFTGVTREAATTKAIEKGWTTDSEGKPVCPKCPGIRLIER